MLAVGTGALAAVMVNDAVVDCCGHDLAAAGARAAALALLVGAFHAAAAVAPEGARRLLELPLASQGARAGFVTGGAAIIVGTQLKVNFIERDDVTCRVTTGGGLQPLRVTDACVCGSTKHLFGVPSRLVRRSQVVGRPPARERARAFVSDGYC